MTLVDNLINFYQIHPGLVWSLIIGYAGSGAIASWLDDYYYASQPRIYEQMMSVWYPLSKLTWSSTNSFVVGRLGAIDHAISGKRVISVRALLVESLLAWVVYTLFFGSVLNNSTAAAFTTTFTAFMVVVAFPFIVAMTVVRACLRHALVRNHTISTLAAISVLGLFVLGLLLVLLLAIAGLFFCLLQAADAYHLSDYEIRDAYLLGAEVVKFAAIVTLKVTLIPFYIYLTIATFASLLVLTLRSFSGGLERELDAETHKIWAYAFRTTWVLGGSLLVVGAVSVATALSDLEIASQELPEQLGSVFARHYIEGFPDYQRKDVALRLQHFVSVAQAPDTNDLLDSTTGLYVFGEDLPRQPFGKGRSRGAILRPDELVLDVEGLPATSSDDRRSSGIDAQ